MGTVHVYSSWGVLDVNLINILFCLIVVIKITNDLVSYIAVWNKRSLFNTQNNNTTTNIYA